MTTQALLPIFQEAAPAGRPDPRAAAIRHCGGVEYREIRTREILNRCLNPRLPFTWTINPYRGCEFGCTYCYARYTHQFFDLGHWRDFERKIFVKRGAARSLERRLRRGSLAGQPIAIGTATDPYQPAEVHYGVTRSILETLRRAEGLEISITTKSPLVARDLDLLRELDRKHSVTVHMTVTTVDSGLARRLEPRAPAPQARLEAARRLAGEGLGVVVFCMPVLPGINAGSRALLPLFEAARDLGACDVGAAPLFLKPAARVRFWPWMRREFPELEPRYRRLYRGGRAYLRARDRTRVLAAYRRLKLEFGFPRPVPGRG